VVQVRPPFLPSKSRTFDISPKIGTIVFVRSDDAFKVLDPDEIVFVFCMWVIAAIAWGLIN